MVLSLILGEYFISLFFGGSEDLLKLIECEL
jgi:hypothetical protein